METAKVMAERLQNSGFKDIGISLDEVTDFTGYTQGCKEVEDNIGKKGFNRDTHEVFVIVDGKYKGTETTYRVRYLKHPRSVTAMMHHSNVIVLNGGAYNVSS